MDASEIFRTNLLKILKDRNLTAASVSRKAGLNLRAIKDIEQRRAKSPRIETVFKIAEALQVSPKFLLGIGECQCAALSDFSDLLELLVELPSEHRALILTIVRRLAIDMQSSTSEGKIQF